MPESADYLLYTSYHKFLGKQGLLLFNVAGDKSHRSTKTVGMHRCSKDHKDVLIKLIVFSVWFPLGKKML